jgi:hypothetical protein
MSPPMATDVHYVCQWESAELAGRFLDGSMAARDDPRWARSGARTAEEYEFWSWRACGLACLEMLLQADASRAGVVALAVEAAERGAFVVTDTVVRGLLYRPFARWVGSAFGLPLDVVENDSIQDLVRRVGTQGPFIASVHPTIRNAGAGHWPPRRGGHLVLVHSCTEDTVTVHNPSGERTETQRDVVIEHDHFRRYYAGRGMQVLDGPTT